MASKQPQITSDELSGLNNPCSSAFLALLCFLEPFHRRTKWTCRPACSYLAAGIKHILRSLQANVSQPMANLVSFPGDTVTNPLSMMGVLIQMGLAISGVQQG